MTTFDILTSSLFDIDLGDKESGLDCFEFLKAEENAMRAAVKLIYNPFGRMMFWSQEVRDGIAGERYMTEAGRRIVDGYRRKAAINPEFRASGEKTIMGHIMSHEYPSEEHRISDLVVFLIAGHETTAHTMSFFLYCLAKYPETQLKLQKELDEVHPTGPSFTTESRSQSRSLFCLSDVANLEYFSHCLKESQR